jgi:PIN domain nuclease of toxin-antitoxin system
MTPLLLDTHVLVWMVQGNLRLKAAVREEIDEAARADAVFVSAITPWEIALLTSKNRITLGADVQEWIDRALGLPGVRLEPLLPSIAVASTRLPWEMHADPADRILVATARHLGAALVTADEQLLRYGAEGRFHCLAAA